jgi:CcmD family protein
MTGQNLQFVIAAYGVTWLVILGYLIRVHRTLGRARLEHDRVTGAQPGASQ